MNVAVIIPHKEHMDRLGLCLACVRPQLRADDELIVVDNGTRDFARVEQVCVAHGAMLLSSLEGGSYRARNVGIEASRAGLVLFTDADCQPVDGWVDAYRTWAGQATRRLAAGPVEVFPAGPRPNPWEVIDIETGYPQARFVALGKAITANLAVRREVFASVGKFDPLLYSTGDVDFTTRASQASGGIDWVPAAAVRHPARATQAEMVERGRRVLQGSVARRIKEGREPVPARIWLLWLVPPVRRLGRFRRVPNARWTTVVLAFFCVCYLRWSQLRILFQMRSAEGVKKLGGRYR